MPNIFQTFKHLAGRSQAWRLIASPFREYIEGFSYFPYSLKEHIDNIWLDIFPSTTRELDKWNRQFALSDSGTVQEQIDNLIGRWRGQGGQGFDYLQDLIHEHGYTNIFLHEWWMASDAYRCYCLAPDSDCGGTNAECGVFREGIALETINPNDYLDDQYLTYCLGPDSDCGATESECGGTIYETKLLVNKGPELYSPDYEFYCLAPDSDCGSGADCGALTEVVFVPVEYEIPQDPIQWRYMIYVGAETFGEIAEIDAALQTEFERLLKRIMPYQQWLGLLINYV